MGRSPPCCDKIGLKKGPWTPEEDQKLLHYIQLHGPTNWRSIPNNAGLQRCGKSCRLRWTNYLRPDIRRGRFTFEEEETIIQLHGILGNKWSTIATHLPGRTDNEIKNYWNTRIRKRLLKMGIDPVTHAPRLDLHDLNLSSLLGLQALMNPQLLRLLIVPSLSPMAISNPQMNLQAPGFQPNQLEVPSSTPYSTPEPCMMPTGATTTVSPNFAYQDQRERTINSPDLSTNAKLGSSVDLDSICNTQNHWSSPLPISTSTSYVNNNINKEDEKDVSYSSMFKFEIPQSLDFGGHG